MRLIVTIILMLAVSAFAQNSFMLYINEVRANDASTDDIEFIELIGPAGTVLTNFQIVHYNGAYGVDGPLWTHTIGTFTLPNDGIVDALDDDNDNDGSNNSPLKGSQHPSC